jgi:hypothetical protein
LKLPQSKNVEDLFPVHPKIWLMHVPSLRASTHREMIAAALNPGDTPPLTNPPPGGASPR